METKNQERKKYLVGKMLDGARTLYDFFEELRNNRDVCPEDLAIRLAEKYDLTPNQRTFLNLVSTRASRAKGIVSYFENRFGLKEGKEFADAQGLYSVLYRKKPLKNLSAFSYNIAIGFVRGRWVNMGKVIGFADNSSTFSDQLSFSLEQTLFRLEKGKTTACADLSFSIPDLNHLEKFAIQKINRETADKKFIRLILGSDEKKLAENVKEELEKHELRHVFDRIIGCPGYPFEELVADLYAINYLVEGLGDTLAGAFIRDTGYAPFRPLYWENELLKLKQFGAPSEIIKITEERLKRKRRQQQEFENSIVSLRNSVKKFPKGQYPIISYLVSTTGSYWKIKKPSHCLELLAENYPPIKTLNN